MFGLICGRASASGSRFTAAGAWLLGIGLGAITAVILALALLGGTLSGIFTVVLYRYATTGDAARTSRWRR